MFIDAHNHLEQYGENLKAALDMIRRHEIVTLGCAMDEETYLYTRRLSQDNPLILPCAGIHPMTAHANCKELDRFDKYVKEAEVIGEIGLDFHWVEDRGQYPSMVQVFDYFVKKAREHDKVTNMHTKGAEEEVLAAIKKHGLRTPIIHWYSGPLDILKKLLDYGCYFTVSVDIGDSELTREIVRILPINRILSETDGPTALEWVNGKYGYPTEVENVVNQISAIKKLPFEEVKDEIFNNFRKLLSAER